MNKEKKQEEKKGRRKRKRKRGMDEEKREGGRRGEGMDENVRPSREMISGCLQKRSCGWKARSSEWQMERKKSGQPKIQPSF